MLHSSVSTCALCPHCRQSHSSSDDCYIYATYSAGSPGICTDVIVRPVMVEELPVFEYTSYFTGAHTNCLAFSVMNL